MVVTPEPDQELTLELLRRGAHGIVSRDVEPELLVDCLRKVSEGHPWLDSRGIQWVLEAYRTQGSRPTSPRPKVQLTPKESLIVSCVTQGMKNKEIALRVGTTEQVVKNYLRKVYDKLGVADRLELALFCLHNRVLDGNAKVPPVPVTSSGNGSAADPVPRHNGIRHQTLLASVSYKVAVSPPRAIESKQQKFPASNTLRRDGRVAEGARLESVFTRKGNVGSNPTLSRHIFKRLTDLQITTNHFKSGWPGNR